MTLPNFLIAGTMKSGTTWLATALRDHPDAFVPEPKEVHFFDSEKRANGIEWYAEHFAGAEGRRAIGEATPNYSAYEEVVQDIAAVLPGIRVILCAREPAARAYSHWRQMYFRLVSEDRKFDRVVSDELALAGAPVRLGEGHHYLHKGLYLDQLDLLERHFGRDRVHVVLMDDIATSPAETFAAACRFLDLDDTVVPSRLHERVNAGSEFRPVWLWRFMTKRGLWDRLPTRVGSFLVLKVMRRLGQGRRPQPLDPAVRERLREYYAEPNARLAERLGRDLSGWAPET